MMGNDTEEQIERLWIEALKQNPTKKDLIRMIRNVPQLRGRALKELMGEGCVEPPTNIDLVLLLQDIEPLREKIWQILLKRNPRREELLYITEHIPELRIEAEAILPPPKKEIFAQIEALAAS